MDSIYLNEENDILIEDYLYKPIDGKHSLIIRNEKAIPINVTINRKIASLEINKVYNHTIDDRSSFTFDFPIDDKIAPDILSLFVDTENLTYQNDNDLITIPYFVPEGNDSMNIVEYVIRIDNSLTKANLLEYSFFPDVDHVDGVTELWYKIDNNESLLPNYKSGKLEKVNYERRGNFTYNNDFKYSMLYLHIFARDSNGNTSDENVIPLDLESPGFVTSGFKINGTELYENIQLNSYNGNTIFEFTPIKTSKDIDVFYDIQLVSYKKDTKVTKNIGKRYSGIMYPDTFDLEFTPTDIENDLYEYYVNVRTFNRYGRSLGFTKSPTFSFKIQEKFNIEYIEVEESPVIPFDADGSTSINSKDRTLIIGYSGYESSTDGNLSIYFRSRDTRDKLFPPTEWKLLTTKYITTANGEIRHTFDSAIMDPNGFKTYDIQVSKRTKDSSYIKKSKYDLMSDSHVVNNELTSNYFIAVRIPLESLKDQSVIISDKIQGEVFSSPKVEIDSFMNCTGVNGPNCYFIAVNKFNTGINMSKYEDMDFMRSEIMSAISLVNISSQQTIYREYNESMDVYIVFNRGNTNTNDYWNGKRSLPTSSVFINKIEDLETSLVSYRGDKASTKVILKDDYKLYKKNNLPKPTLTPNINPEISYMADGTPIYLFREAINLKTTSQFGLDVKVDYDYDDDEIENTITSIIDYTPGSYILEPGYYKFNARSAFVYGLETFYSEPTLYNFQIIGNDSLNSKIPIFKEIVDNNGKVTLVLETNNVDNVFSYKFIETNTGKDISSTFIKYDNETSNVKFRKAITTFGIYNFTVIYSNTDFEDEVSTVLTYYDDLNPIETPDGVLNFHKSTNTPLNNRYNNAYLETKTGSAEDKWYIVNITEAGVSSKIMLSSGYVIPFFNSAVIKMVEATVSNSNRNHIHDPLSTVVETNPANPLGTGHKVTKEKTYTIDRINSSIIPPKPIVNLYSDSPVNGSFSSNPTENSINKVMNSVEISVSNNDIDYETIIMINGEIFSDTNIKYERVGNHRVIVIYKDKYNYTMSYNSFIINIRKSYSYSPIQITRYPLKAEHFTKAKDFNFNGYTKESLISYENTLLADKYLIDVNFFFVTNEMLIRRNHPEISAESLLCKYKQYKINNGSWINYVDNQRLVISDPCTVYVRKVMIDDTVIEDKLELNPTMFGYMLPIPPVFLSNQYNNKDTGYSYFPVVDKKMGHTYRLEVNGHPFKFGVPLVSNGSVEEYEDFEIKAYSKHYKFPDREASTTIRFRALNRPPEKPYLLNLVNGEINHITDKNFVLTLKEIEPNVRYFIKVNDRIVQNNQKLFEDDNYSLNGKFLITVIAKNELGLTSSTGYYVDNNKNIADDYHSKEYQRNSLILTSRNKKNYEFNNEMIMDLRTGDISYIDTAGNIVDVTMDMKERLNEIEAKLSTIQISNVIITGNTSQYANDLSYLIDNNNFLEKTLTDAISKIKGIDSEVNKSNKMYLDMKSIKEKVDRDVNILVNLTNSVSIKTTEINNNVSRIETEVLNTLPVQRNNISLSSRNYYNIKSVELVAKTKINKTTVASHKKKYENFLVNIKSKIKNF